MADETKEERAARLTAEAQARAAEALAQRKAQEAAEKASKDNEEIAFYSIFPTFQLCIQSETKELIAMTGGTFRDVATVKNRTIKFQDHRGVVRRGDVPTVRRCHRYGDAFVEARDLNDGDKLAASLEKWHKTNDRRGQQFSKAIEARGRRIDPNPVLDDLTLRREVAALVERGVFA